MADKEAKESVEIGEKASKEEKSEMLALIDRVVANSTNSTSNHESISSRKGYALMMSDTAASKRSRIPASDSSDDSE